MISIINYGMGNLRSVSNALGYFNTAHQITDSGEKILLSDKLILPGVGSFKAAMDNIRNRGLLDILNRAVLERKIPILGICLGMQLLAETGYEGGETKGLGWIQGDVKLINTSLKLPHIGFNTARIVQNQDNSIFKELDKEVDFYFVHSYAMQCQNKDNITCLTDYGGEFVSAVQKENIFGVQFHPEKSQSSGLMVIKNFINI